MKLLLLLLLLYGCAPKKEKPCPKEEVLHRFLEREVPRNFVMYGVLRYGPLSSPMMLSKEDGFYRVKIARGGKVSVSERVLCIRGRCYLLPLPPEFLLFGRVLSGNEELLCVGGTLVFKKRAGVYERRVLFEGSRLTEMVVRNLRNGKEMKVLFGDEKPEGFFRSIIFELNGESLRLDVEEVIP